jgi:hypothetical protein
MVRDSVPNAYFGWMLKTFEFCIPVAGTKVPDGPALFINSKFDRSMFGR